MIVSFFTLPVIAYVSMLFFQRMGFTVTNFEGKKIPYSLGIVILYSYFTLCFFGETPTFFSIPSSLYVVGVWFLGLIDDVFGTPFPKGLKGHFQYALKHRVLTTGGLKVIGTVLFAFVYLYESDARLWTSFVPFLLLTGCPHVMNLLDTRPLRVWKLSFLLACFFIIVETPSFDTIVAIAFVFYIVFLIEGKKLAMLGDNGATLVGAIAAHFMIEFTSSSLQIVFALSTVAFILCAEKWSLSALVNRYAFLKTLDRFGVSE